MRFMDADRRRRFVAWFDRAYGSAPGARQRFMTDSGRTGLPPLTKGRTSQYFDPRQPFGERAGRQIAVRFGLPEDFFERDEDDLGAEAIGLARRFQALTPVERARLLRLLDAARDEPAPAPAPSNGTRHPGDASKPADEFLGGMSAFGGLDEIPSPRPRERKTKK